MKTPKARKLPSGAWFVRVMVDGERISITRDTEKAAVAEAMAVKARMKSISSGNCDVITIREAMDMYIEKRSRSCSPSSIRSYRIYQRNQFQGIMDRPIGSIKDADFQRAVNAERVSAKTLRCAWTTVAAAIKEATGRDVPIVLPQIVKHERECIMPEDIPAFLEAVKGHPVEIPALLGLHSLRRSETMGLTWKDVDLKKNIIHVRGAAVYDENQKLVRKETNKTSNSRRDIPIMIPRLAELLVAAPHDSEYVVTCSTNTFNRHLAKVCEANNLPRIGTHGLRHSFASLAFHVGMPEDIAMRIGGWDDYQTMKKIYTHISDRDINKYANAMSKFYNP